MPWRLFLFLPAAIGQTPGPGPYDLVAVQLLEEECPASTTSPNVLNAWKTPTVASLEARSHLAGNFGRQHRAAALAYWLQALLRLFEDALPAAFQCSALCAQHLQSTAEWSLSLDHPRRARILLQLGNAFKFQALKDFANLYHEMKAVHGNIQEALKTDAVPKRFLPRLHVQYQIMLGELHGALRVEPLPWKRIAEITSDIPRVEIHSICSYKPDPTSKTSLESPLLELSVPNHRAYAQRHGYRYVVHTESALPDREAHYSKMYVVYHRFLGQEPHWAHQPTMPAGPPPDWIFFIDCDAFFTDFSTSLGDLIATHSAAMASQRDMGHAQFLVAEDPGGINTGVFLIRKSAWSMEFLERVSSSNFMVAWDQSMFFWHMIRGALDIDLDQEEDFLYPSEIRLVHQAQFNAFVPPASVDWMAYEWRPGDFVRHFAGCPWQDLRQIHVGSEEQLCLDMMLVAWQWTPMTCSRMVRNSSDDALIQPVWLDDQRSEWIGSCQLSAINLLAYGFASKDMPGWVQEVSAFGVSIAAMPGLNTVHSWFVGTAGASHSWQSITSVPVYRVRNLGMADRKAVTINVGGEQIIQVRPELFNVVGDNHFASMFSERWQNQLDAEGHLFVDYSPRVFLPLIEFLRLVRDSEPDMPAPVVVEPFYRRAWIRMVLALSFHPEVLRKAGIRPDELRDCGCAKVLRDAGFTATELLASSGNQQAPFSLRELAEIGYSTLELREVGFSLESLRATEHFTLQELFDGGFVVEEWRAVGFAPQQMVRGGFTLQQLRVAGFELQELRTSGFTPPQFLDGGFTFKELGRAGFALGELQEARLTLPQLREVGFRAQQLWRAGVTADRLFWDCHFTLEELRQDGFTLQELLEGGLTVEHLRTAGLAFADLREAGCEAQQLIESGFTFQDFQDDWLTVQQLAHGGLTIPQLRQAGMELVHFRMTGLTPLQLFQGGFTLEELQLDGVTLEQLIQEGVTIEQLRESGLNLWWLREAGFTPQELVEGGVTLQELQSAGFTIQQLVDTGFTARQWMEAKVTPFQLCFACGFTLQDLRRDALTAEELVEEGLTVRQLRESGLELLRLREVGFTPQELLDDGVSLRALPSAGFTIHELVVAGFTLQQLQEVGFTARQWMEAKVSPWQLCFNCGFTLQDLQRDGLTPQELAEEGLTVEKLRGYGMELSRLQKAGFTPQELLDGGFTPEDLGVLDPSWRRFQ
ncbi:unnamed protein product [Cladocopium goreaui]|uniref:BTB domain-containing protein n=1 Tax=Cladocopium goreaui TaxID=2562237 RepID=A0A9P1FJT0_9DINO|nr:unnamed protein product [Cladocopium goreaui]